MHAGSLSDLSNLANASLYGFEDYHGVDIGVVRAVRLWYIPAAGELEIEIKLQEGDTKLGFAISRTEEVLSNNFLTWKILFYFLSPECLLCIPEIFVMICLFKLH